MNTFDSELTLDQSDASVTSLEKLNFLKHDVSELSRDVEGLLDSSSLALKSLDCLVSKKQSEFIRNSMLG